MLPFHTILSREPLKPLMRSGLYPIVYFVVTEFGGTITDVQLKAMRKGVREFAPRVRIAERQREDGGWDPTDDERDELDEALLTLFKLADFAVNQYDAVVQLAADFVYRHQLPGGLLPVNLSENGFALWTLTNLGYIHTRDNNRMIRKLLSLQRSDGGWGKAQTATKDVDPDNVPSDVSSTMHVLLGLSAFEEYQDSPETKLACEFLISRLFKRTKSQGFRRTRDWHVQRYDWNEIGALGWPATKMLYILSRYGYLRTDEPVAQLYRWIRNAQLKNGMWGHNEDGNEWLTIWTLRAIRRLYYPDFKSEHSDLL